MANLKELKIIAKDLNAVMGLDPAIKTSGNKTDLAAAIANEAAEIDAGDAFTDATWEYLEAEGLGERKKSKKGKKGKDKPAPAAEPDADEAADEPKAKKGKKDKGKKAKAKKVPRITKKSIVLKMTGTKKGATVEDMAQACTDADLGDMDLNRRVVVLWLRKLGWKNCKKKDLASNPKFKASDIA